MNGGVVVFWVESHLVQCKITEAATTAAISLLLISGYYVGMAATISSRKTMQRFNQRINQIFKCEEQFLSVIQKSLPPQVI